jgi:hypothetical protein
LGLLFARALLFLQALFPSILIRVIVTETSVPLRTIGRDAQGPAVVLVFGVQVADLCALGGLVEGEQGLGFVVHDVQGEVHARLGEDRGSQRDKSKEAF